LIISNYNSNNFTKYILLSFVLLIPLIYIILIKYYLVCNIFTILIIIFLSIFYFYIINLSIKFHKFYKNINYIENKPLQKNNNIKIALCLTGKIDENIEKIYNNLKKNLLDHYDIDIFMNVDIENNLVKKLYKPKKYFIYNELVKINNYLEDGMNTMYYRIYECNKYTKIYEKENNFTYDLIIRLRVDVNLNERVYLENFLYDHIYFPARSIYGDSSNIYHQESLLFDEDVPQ
jgi:hypothetical protein